MNSYMNRARSMRKQLNSLIKDFDDETAVANKELYPDWNGNGISVIRGELLYYKNELYRVNQDHVTQNDWAPDITPALFTRISLDEYPEWVQPTGAQDAYNMGDKCNHNSKHWVSTLDGNVWEPGVYGWAEV